MRASPAYDLMCTRIHTPMESDVALDLFEGDIDFTYMRFMADTAGLSLWN